MHAKILIRIAAAAILAAALLLVGTPAWAQPTAPASLDQVIGNLRGWLVGLLVGLATLFLTIGGVRYLAADGDPGQVEQAKRSLRNAAIGYALAALAPLLVTILRSFVG